MPTVPVRHALGSYDVHIEPGALLALPEMLATAMGTRPLVLITDDIVGRYYDEWTRATTDARALGARAELAPQVGQRDGQLDRLRQQQA